MNALHSIRFSCQGIHHQLFVLQIPVVNLFIRVNDRLSVILDVLLLSGCPLGASCLDKVLRKRKELMGCLDIQFVKGKRLR
jgi:hypothetical protein